jgi:hypothetical protein
MAKRESLLDKAHLRPFSNFKADFSKLGERLISGEGRAESIHPSVTGNAEGMSQAS